MADRRPVLFRNGTVLTMDDSHTVLTGGDVLVVGDRVAEVGTGLSAPEGAVEVDATGGIVMPGMIDTHRHMWQTAMRAYGADWTLTQYFVWYYLEHGKHFRPEDIHAGNLVSAWDALEAGVTTTVDWSHGLQTVDHADAAVDALQAVPGRFVLAYGNIQAAPWEWTADPAVKAFFDRRRSDDDMLGFQIAFDVLGEESFPEGPAFEFARELGLAHTTHAGVWGATNDNGIRLVHDNGFATPQNIYVHAATLTTDSYHRIAASGGSVSVSTESEQSAGQGYPPTWQVRRHDIPVSLSHDTSVWWSSDLFSAMRTTLGADRSREHLEAHAAGETVTHSHLRAEQVVDWATRGGARALGRDDLGQLTPGKKADVVLIKNDDSAFSFPLINPYGQVAFQAQRGDVHTVVVDGHVVKSEHKLVGADLPAVRNTVANTVDFIRSTIGQEAWDAGMNPDLPDDDVLDNPYQYTDYKSDSTREARGTIFGEPGSGSRGVVAGRGTGPDFVEALARGLDVIAALGGGPMSLAEVAAAADLARPTARRLLLTLEELGYVSARDAGYALTPRVLRLGTAYVASQGLWDVARPHLQDLVARTGESSSMAQLDGSDIVYVARVSVPKIIALRVEIGTRFPAAQTSQGKVLLAALPPDEVAPTLAVPSQSGLPPYIGQNIEQQMSELAQVRARGWALADEELAPGVRSVAVPVRDGAGAVRAAMNVTVHAAETSVDTLLDDHLPHLLRAAGEVSAEWALWQSRPHVEMARPVIPEGEPAEAR